MSWGKGGMTGVGKAIWQHERAQILAAAILEKECGDKHVTGSHSLCPKCQAAAASPHQDGHEKA